MGNLRGKTGGPGAAAILFAALLVLPCGLRAADTLIPADDPAINYYGRFDFSNPKAPRFNWSGSTIEFAVKGTTTVGMEMADGAGYFDVEVDGNTQAAPIKADSYAAKKYVLASGLSTGDHVIRVVRRNEPYWVIAAFGGVYVAEGGSLTPRPKPARKMEFVGDSWTAGYFNEGCADQQANTNTNQAWARLTSRAFHAQDIILAESGIGLAKSLGGKAVMPKRYPDTFDTAGGAATPAWDFAWKPDIVSIFLGINDKNAGATDAQYTAAVHAFVATLRGHYPDAAILFMSLGGGNMDAATKAAVAAETTSLGHPRVYYHEVKINVTGCQYHPNLAEAKAISDAAIARIMQITGWDTAQAPMSLKRKRTGALPAGYFRSEGLPFLAIAADGRIAAGWEPFGDGNVPKEAGSFAAGALWTGVRGGRWTRLPVAR